jgi:hypothetical protein
MYIFISLMDLYGVKNEFETIVLPEKAIRSLLKRRSMGWDIVKVFRQMDSLLFLV